MSITRDLARAIIASRPPDLPREIRHESVRALVNWIGLPVWGSRDEMVEKTFAALDPFSGPRQASLLGRPEKLDPIKAALLNAISASVPDYDDTHLATVIHPTGPAASALLALVETHRASGADFLHALAWGIEVQCRAAKAFVLPPAKHNGAWFLTGVTGGIGAAVAAGLLLGLSEDQMVWAIGIAAARAAGSRETHGSMVKNLVTGCTAEEGVFAALLAAQGVSGPETPIEGARGLGSLLSEGASFAPLADKIGQEWELLQNAYKPFPCGIVIHAPITAALEVERVPVAAIEAVRLKVNPLCLALCGRREPKNAVEGTFSVYHWVAVALIHHVIGIRHYSDDTVRDPAIIALRDRVTASADAGLRKDEAEIELTLRDGRTIRHHVDHAIGTIERPPSDEDLEKKLLDLAGVRLGNDRARALAEVCWALPEAADAKVVVDAACQR